uniref:Uncharacterized protein n=1 Tax=Cyprinus carpio TaxID=7962 RepID=A0A8C1N205_CYPCA
MNKFYIETKLNRDLRDDLMKLFSDHVAEKHVGTLLPLLKKAHSMPFQVKPSTMASVVKGLYALRPGERDFLFFNCLCASLCVCSSELSYSYSGFVLCRSACSICITKHFSALLSVYCFSDACLALATF